MTLERTQRFISRFTPVNRGDRILADGFNRIGRGLDAASRGIALPQQMSRPARQVAEGGVEIAAFRFVSSDADTITGTRVDTEEQTRIAKPYLLRHSTWASFQDYEDGIPGRDEVYAEFDPANAQHGWARRWLGNDPPVIDTEEWWVSPLYIVGDVVWATKLTPVHTLITEVDWLDDNRDARRWSHVWTWEPASAT